MGIILPYNREKLFVGILFHDVDLMSRNLTVLVEKFGEIESISPITNFSYFSSYYDVQMGGVVSRIFISFKELIDPSDLSAVKIWTNGQEEKEKIGNLRRINLDPGLISAGRVALATTKNAGHRISLRYGIYAEITLFYAKKSYHPLPWTYPDFRYIDTQKWFLAVRHQYISQVKHER